MKSPVLVLLFLSGFAASAAPLTGDRAVELARELAPITTSEALATHPALAAVRTDQEARASLIELAMQNQNPEQAYAASSVLATLVALEHPGTEGTRSASSRETTMAETQTHLKMSLSHDVHALSDARLMEALGPSFSRQAPQGMSLERVAERFPVLYRVLAQSLTQEASVSVRSAAEDVLKTMASARRSSSQIFGDDLFQYSWISPERVALGFLRARAASTNLESDWEFLRYRDMAVLYYEDKPAKAELGRLVRDWAVTLNPTAKVEALGVYTERTHSDLEALLASINEELKPTPGLLTEKLEAPSGELAAALSGAATRTKLAYFDSIKTQWMNGKPISTNELDRVTRNLAAFAQDPSDLEAARGAIEILARIRTDDARVELEVLMMANNPEPLRIEAIVQRAHVAAIMAEKEPGQLGECRIDSTARLADPRSEAPVAVRKAARDSLNHIAEAILKQLNSPAAANTYEPVTKLLLEKLAETRSHLAIPELQRFARDKGRPVLARAAFNGLVELADAHTDAELIERLGAKALECSLTLTKENPPL